MGIYSTVRTYNLNEHIIQPYQNPIHLDEPIFYYHSDHLGSASFLTDNNGNETQQLVYLPFGEGWVDLKYNTQQFETPYKFNGKEKDLESGYNYYGARYYYDWLSIWLSVDPLSDKYPHVTNYVYCSNNPVMVVDPDGRDEWEVCLQTGKMDWKKESDKDIIFLTYGGKRTGKHSKEFDKGSFMRAESTDKNERGMPNYSYISFANKETGQEIFNFLADNTEVEWSKVLAEYKATGIERIYVFTSHRKDSEERGAGLVQTEDFSKDYNLIEFEHSHPNKRNPICPQCSSKADIKHKNETREIHPNAEFYIRHSWGQRRNYTNDTEQNNGR